MAKDQTLSQFLLERYDEDDYLAGQLEPGALPDGLTQSRTQRILEPRTLGDGLTQSRTQRILADSAAKRRIVELHGRKTDNPGWCPTCATPDDTQVELRYEQYPCPTLRVLAQPYADHDDFREEWWPADEPLEKLRWRWRRSTSWLQEYAGLDLEAAQERAEAEGRPYRVIGPHTAITLDLRSDRLNLWVDADGTMTGMSAC